MRGKLTAGTFLGLLGVLLFSCNRAEKACIRCNQQRFKAKSRTWWEQRNKTFHSELRLVDVVRPQHKFVEVKQVEFQAHDLGKPHAPLSFGQYSVLGSPTLRACIAQGGQDSSRDHPCSTEAQYKTWYPDKLTSLLSWIHFSMLSK